MFISIGAKLDITFVTFLHYERCQKEKKNEIFA